MVCGILEKIPVHMDYEGQRLAEKLFQIIILVAGAIGFVWGYLVQRFSITVYGLGIGFALACLVVLPAWPFYRQHPLAWLKPQPEASGKSDSGAAAKKAKKKN